MKWLVKLTSWMLLSWVAAAPVFAQSRKAPPPINKNPGDQLAPNQYMPAYEAPGRINPRGSWDIYSTASFTYWQAIQENMQLGTVTTTRTSGAITSSWNNLVQMDSKYKPGFQLGLGLNFDHDNWDGFAQYTWFRGTNQVTTTLNTTNATTITPHWTTGLVGATDTELFTGTESWRLHMDLLDMELARSGYKGLSLTFRPFFGFRAAWIRQHLGVLYTGTAGTDPATLQLSEYTHSWGVGPRIGAYSNWLLGQGVRLYGNGSVDLLYTCYTKLAYRGADAIVGGARFNTLAPQDNVNSVRPHLDLEFGLGWGTYFDNNNWHIDLAAGYGFQVFFNQNMFRQIPGDDIPFGNLYIQGMTASARFDF